MNKYVVAVSAALGLAVVSSSASAAIFDSGVLNFQYYAYGGPYSGLGSPTTFAAPGSATFFDYFTVSASGNKITYTYNTDTTWSPSATSLNSGGLYIDNGSLISAVSGIAPFTSVTLDAASQLGGSGFTSSNVTWNSANVAVSWANLPFAAGNTVILDVNGVPEASTWVMMLLGFAGLGFASYRASRRTTAQTA